jgi:hypothetical protein
MSGLPTAMCKICGRYKHEVNHWLVAIAKPGFEGILIQAAEAASSPRNPEFIYEDLCGQGCAHKRLSRYLDELNALFTTQETEDL